MGSAEKHKTALKQTLILLHPLLDCTPSEDTNIFWQLLFQHQTFTCLCAFTGLTSFCKVVGFGEKISFLLLARFSSRFLSSSVHLICMVSNKMLSINFGHGPLTVKSCQVLQFFFLHHPLHLRCSQTQNELTQS